jgi:predicted ATPase
MHKYVLTGGPGSGKSSLLLALRERGYSCSQEVSRQVIMEELANHSNCLPWGDLSCFAEKVLRRMVDAYHAMGYPEDAAGASSGDRPAGGAPEGHAIGAPTFFDRGIPDIIAYLRVAGLPVQEHFYAAAQDCPYEKTVFLLPPWRHIYVQDPARWQTYEESERLFDEIRKTYRKAGYHITELPRAPVEKRANFILNGINTKPCANSVF